MQRWVVGSAAALVSALALYAGLTAWVMLDTSTLAARAIFDQADPLDRAPPPLVVGVLDAHGLRARLPEALAVVLLDERVRGRTDWVVDRPLLVWHLERTFTRAQLTGLYVATLNTGAVAPGLSAGAWHYYGRPLNELDVEAVSCLVRKAAGIRRAYPGGACGNEGVPPPAVYTIVARPKGRHW